jgi:hypothetical protein
MKIDKRRNIDQLYDELPESERTIALVLRELVLETIEVKAEKLAWGAPFYYGHSPICFIWPASIPWGKIQSGVALGFWRGKLLDDPDFFDRGTAKQVFRKAFYRPEEIDVEKVQQLLINAEMEDKRFYLASRSAAKK